MKLFCGFILFVFGLLPLPASAAPFFFSPPDTLGPLNGGIVTELISSPGFSAVGGATLTFDLLGYLTVDGSNCCTDTFSFTINGNLLFMGKFDMGGGGSQVIDFIDPGVTVVSTSAIYGQGGLTQFLVAHTLLSGVNTYLFDYGVMQGLADEGWGLRSIQVSANITSSAVPEPTSIAAFGLGSLVALYKGRRRARSRFKYDSVDGSSGMIVA